MKLSWLISSVPEEIFTVAVHFFSVSHFTVIVYSTGFVKSLGILPGGVIVPSEVIISGIRFETFVPVGIVTVIV